jgi:RNA polymerase sigma-70 factor (family 1)
MISYRTSDEGELLKLIKEGSYPAFNELYERHWSALYGSAYNILRDKEACLDLVQDIFVWFWENRAQWELQSCKGYLLTAVKFKTANYLRNAKSRGLVIHQLATLNVDYEDDALEVRQLEVLIKEVSDRLPDRCREVFQLSRYEYLSNKEIASKLQLSEKTVENQLTIALKRLRKALNTSYSILFFL